MAEEPDILVDLTTARTDFEADTIAESLRAQGIPAQAFTAAGWLLQWDVAASQPMRVQVRQCDLELARAALRAIRAESVDIDWSEVDTGDRTPVTEDERAAERRRVEEGARCWCVGCRYEVTGLPRAGQCPECGRDLAVVRTARPVSPVWRRGRRVWLGLFCALVLAWVIARHFG